VKEEYRVTVRPANIIQTKETDIPTLQGLCRSNYAAYLKAEERLKKARRQRDRARAEAERLQKELDILLEAFNRLERKVDDH
jgi:hypothetical protein